MAPNDSRSVMPTPEQQKVLDRILVQRERVRARRAAFRQVKAIEKTTHERVEPGAPLTVRLLTFARLHPVVVAVVVGAAVVAGPSRVIRWTGMLMPLVSRMRRG